MQIAPSSDVALCSAVDVGCVAVIVRVCVGCRCYETYPTTYYALPVFAKPREQTRSGVTPEALTESTVQCIRRMNQLCGALRFLARACRGACGASIYKYHTFNWIQLFRSKTTVHNRRYGWD